MMKLSGFSSCLRAGTVGPGEPPRTIKEFTIPLPGSRTLEVSDRAANYGEAVKLVGMGGSRSVGQASDTRARLCQQPLVRLRNVIEVKRKRRAGARLVSQIRTRQRCTDVKQTQGDIRISHPELPEVAVQSTVNPFDQLSSDDECNKQRKLKGVARSVVRHLSMELGVPADLKALPERIECGYLRSAVRSCFPAALPEVAELSLKTVQKLERGCCKFCEPRFMERLDEWKKARFDPVMDDPEHLQRFTEAFARNVPLSWNRRKAPYIPNGSATLSSKRREGGNWNEESFSDLCRAELVFSSGKPRIVTLYSSYNTSVLTPLHLSLYEELRRRGWLLVGPPTSSRVAGLNGGGDFLSFDYVGATDSLSTAYVRAAIEVLISRAEDMTEEEKRCLRVLGHLRFEEGGPSASRGQPMGSVMSFPLLCLFNKTIVDLSLDDLHAAKQITFKEWSAHRCLINGDDLLLREPRKGRHDLYPRICFHAGAVGTSVNKEKSMVSDCKAEINSTLFVDCEEVKKVNASALYMKPTVNDVIGFAHRSVVSVAGFKRVVRANARFLKNQADKGDLRLLPRPYIEVCRKDKKIRKALTSLPLGLVERPDANFFVVEPRPDDYGLSRDEEIASIESHRDQVRESAIKYCSTKEKKRRSYATEFATCSFRSLCRRRNHDENEVILRVLARAWERKKRERLVEEDGLSPSFSGADGCLPPSDLPNKAMSFIDAIKAFRLTRQSHTRCTPAAGDLDLCPDYVRL